MNEGMEKMPVFKMKSLNDFPLTEPSTRFKGLPISVAIPPMLSMKIVMNTSGVGSISMESAMRNIIGKVIIMVMTLSRKAEVIATIIMRKSSRTLKLPLEMCRIFMMVYWKKPDLFKKPTMIIIPKRIPNVSRSITCRISSPVRIWKAHTAMAPAIAATVCSLFPVAMRRYVATKIRTAISCGLIHELTLKALHLVRNWFPQIFNDRLPGYYRFC